MMAGAERQIAVSQFERYRFYPTIPLEDEEPRACREIPASDMTALEAVMSVDAERQRLEKEAEGLIADESEEAQARLEDVYER